jgi:N6-adenosine-specific RNA methylase IME4
MFCNLPEKRYGVLYVDPPYRWEPWSRATGMGGAADNHYGTVPLDPLKALKIPADKNAALLLWATVPMMPQALDLMTALDFEYRSQMVWVKPSIGLGYWWRNQHEILLLGIRGKMRAPARGTQFPSVLLAPRRRHSEKPDEVAGMLERMFPGVPRLEMFARTRRPGWDSWGDEV